MRIRLLLLFLGLTLLTCKNAPEPVLVENPSAGLDSGISAHRGGKDLQDYPENCLQTMQYLHEKGIQIFEIDIQATRDKTLVLMHDESLNRTTTGSGKLKKLSYDELQNLRLTDNFGNVTDFAIPTLLEVLEWGKKADVYFMLDFKSQNILKQVVREVRIADMEQNVVLISYSQGAAVRMHKVAPEMKLSVAIRNQREFNSMMDSGIPIENMIAFTGTRLSKPELYADLEEKGIPAILGTLGNLDRRAEARGDTLYKDWQNMGIDIFATDRPLEVQKALND